MKARSRLLARPRAPAPGRPVHAPALVGDPAAAEHPLLTLQRAIGNQAVQRLLRVGGVIRRAPQVGWTVKDATSPNAAKSAIGKMERVPLEGLTEGNQLPNAVTETDEEAAGRAIAVVPDKTWLKIDPAQPIEVLLHLHGMSVGDVKSAGYRARKKAGPALPGAPTGALAAGTVRDVSLDRIAAQLQDLITSARPARQIIAVLPQGTTATQFGAAGFQSAAYLDEVFAALVAKQFLPASAKPGPVILSGHSGGGNTIGHMMANDLAGLKPGVPAPKKPGKGKPNPRDSRLPLDTRELLLFDAINVDEQVPTVVAYLGKRFAEDVQKLAALRQAGAANSEQTAYLAGSFRFRGVYTFSGYAARYQQVQTAIDGLINGAKAKLKLNAKDADDATIIKGLKANYRTYPAAKQGDDPTTKKKEQWLPVHHEAMIGANDNLREAMTRSAP